MAYKEKMKFLKEKKKEDTEGSPTLKNQPIKRKSTNIEEGVESKKKTETYLNLMDFETSPKENVQEKEKEKSNNPFAEFGDVKAEEFGEFDKEKETKNNSDFNFDFN